jgi:hypothetical protein
VWSGYTRMARGWQREEMGRGFQLPGGGWTESGADRMPLDHGTFAQCGISKEAPPPYPSLYVRTYHMHQNVLRGLHHNLPPSLPRLPQGKIRYGICVSGPALSAMFSPRRIKGGSSHLSTMSFRPRNHSLCMVLSVLRRKPAVQG